MNENDLKKYAKSDGCPVRNVLDRFGDKWSILVLLVLGDADVLRFNELHKCIDTISQKMLAVTLRTLEADGLVNRTIYPQIPPRVEYELTDRGKSLLPLIRNLVDWAKENMPDIRQSRANFTG